MQHLKPGQRDGEGQQCHTQQSARPLAVPHTGRAEAWGTSSQTAPVPAPPRPPCTPESSTLLPTLETRNGQTSNSFSSISRNAGQCGAEARNAQRADSQGVSPVHTAAPWTPNPWVPEGRHRLGAAGDEMRGVLGQKNTGLHPVILCLSHDLYFPRESAQA